MCVSCRQSRPCAAAKHLMARSAVGGASVTAASVSARPLNRGSSTAHAASATTGSVLHIMGKRAMVRTIICVKHCFVSILSDCPSFTCSTGTWLHIFYYLGTVVSDGSVSDAAELLTVDFTSDELANGLSS